MPPLAAHSHRQALAPEFAAWRYGREIGRRFRQRIAWTVGGGLAGGCVFGGLILAGAGSHEIGLMMWPAWIAWGAFGARQIAQLDDQFGRRPPEIDKAIRVPNGTERPYAVYLPNLRETALGIGDDEHGWSIDLVHCRGRDIVKGAAASRALSVLLARVNRAGGSAANVRYAVDAMTRVGPAEYPGHIARRFAKRHEGAVRDIAYSKRHGFGPAAAQGDPTALPSLPADVRLALEMAVHEQSEQRAIDGDLVALEAAWREAEEIAAIADEMFLPDSVHTWIKAHK